MTAYDSPGLRLEAQKAGVTDYVTKPPHPENLQVNKKVSQRKRVARGAVLIIPSPGSALVLGF